MVLKMLLQQILKSKFKSLKGKIFDSQIFWNEKVKRKNSETNFLLSCFIKTSKISSCRKNIVILTMNKIVTRKVQNENYVFCLGL